MATESSQAAGTAQTSALDASLRLVRDLAEALSGQVGRAVRQLEQAPGIPVPSPSVEALRAETAELARECQALRDRLGVAETPFAVPAPSRLGPEPAYVPRRSADARRDAAITLARELRALGIERDEVASRLLNTFEVEDSDGILDTVFVEP